MKHMKSMKLFLSRKNRIFKILVFDLVYDLVLKL